MGAKQLTRLPRCFGGISVGGVQYGVAGIDRAAMWCVADVYLSFVNVSSVDVVHNRPNL